MISFATIFIVGSVGNAPTVAMVKDRKVLEFDARIAEAKGEYSNIRVKVWDNDKVKLATLLANTLSEGMPVSVLGAVRQERWTNKVTKKPMSRLVVIAQKVSRPTEAVWNAIKDITGQLEETPMSTEEIDEYESRVAFDRADGRFY